MILRLDPQFLVAFMLATVRCGAWLSIAPPFQGAVPVRVRAALSMGLGLAMAPRMLDAAGELSTETWPLLAATFHNAAIGLILGFLVYILFQSVSAAGGMIDAFAALTSAMLFDPMTKSSSGPVSRLYATLGTAVLFVTNGHLLLLAGLSRTFDMSPTSGIRLDRIGTLITRDVASFFVAAVQIGAPILGALFVTEILLGLASRAAPKLNVMVVGFGAKSLVLFMLLGAALPLIPYVTAQLLDEAMTVMRAAVRGG